MTEEKHEEELFDDSPFGEDETPAAEPSPAPEGEQKQPETEAKQEQPEEKAVEPEPKAEQPQPDKPMVPLAALHEVRDELKAMKAEREREAAERQQPQEQVAPPDMFEDPEGWQAYQQQQFQQAIYGERLTMSEKFAVQQFGKEAVEAAMEWGRQKCASDPYFNASVMNNPDPVGFAVQQYQREQVDPSEFDQFRAWKAAQAQAQQQPAQQQQQPSEKPPKSIASAPSAGGVQHTALGQEAVFDEEFN